MIIFCKSTREEVVAFFHIRWNKVAGDEWHVETLGFSGIFIISTRRSRRRPTITNRAYFAFIKITFQTNKCWKNVVVARRANSTNCCVVSLCSHSQVRWLCAARALIYCNLIFFHAQMINESRQSLWRWKMLVFALVRSFQILFLGTRCWENQHFVDHQPVESIKI